MGGYLFYYKEIWYHWKALDQHFRKILVDELQAYRENFSNSIKKLKKEQFKKKIGKNCSKNMIPGYLPFGKLLILPRYFDTKRATV